VPMDQDPIRSVRRRSLPPLWPRRGRLEVKTTNHNFPDGSQDSSSETIGDLDHRPGTGTQVTESWSHPEWRSRKNGKFTGDIGGPFFSERTYVVGECPPVFMHRKIKNVVSNTTTDIKYRGPFLPRSPSSFTFPSVTPSSNSLLNALGAEMIAACKPTNSPADVSTFLGELLREKLPSMIGLRAKQWKDKTKEARKVPSEEYLNWEFGWKPVVNEIFEISSAIQHAEAVLRQYERDAGKLVRRRFELPPESSGSVQRMTSTRSCYINPDHGGLHWSQPNSGVVERIEQSSTRRWFSGAFTYGLPKGYDPRNQMHRNALMAKQVFGLVPTPDTIWNLAPWSWAVDWFSNTGAVISNLEDWATDGLVMRWGYVMEHKISKHTYTYSGPTGFLAGPVSPPNLTFVHETKKRLKASPFGFGLTWEGFSARQIAILTSLGINRT